MSRVYKILSKMQNNPLDWRIEHFETVAQSLGIVVRKTSGSHVIFEHSRWIEALSILAHRPIKPIYVKKFLALVECLSLEGNYNEH